MSVDRSWMERRIADDHCDVSDEFKQGVEEFLDFAYAHPEVVFENTIRCPCSKCKLKKYHCRDVVTVHLYNKGFVRNYKIWLAHGELFVGEPEPSTFANNNEVPVDRINPYRNLVIDAASPEFNWNPERPDVDASSSTGMPNADASRFYDMLKDADEPLWEGCKKHTKLSAVSQLLNCKAECNMSENCFDCMLSIVKSMLPEDEKLPENFYKSKKMVKKLELGYEKIHACVNDCMLYYKENKDKKECLVCGHPRFKPNRGGNGKQKDIPCKVLRYFPLAPRLKRLYMSTSTAEHMTWHKKSHCPIGVASHPADCEAWKHFDRNHPSFSAESRNVRLGLSTDGFNPFGHSAVPYSCWPVIVTPYNLPPWMCMKQPYMFLSLLIPGPKSPGKDLDVYLRPLIDELKMLWEDGVNTYDAFKKQNFQMKAAVMWTISDFPAYAMLSGWSTHGRMSCPYCMECTKSFILDSGKKPCFFDCHRQFLPTNHPYRKQRDNFKKNTIEKDSPPPRLSGEEVLNRVLSFDQITFGKVCGKQKIHGHGEWHNWVKRSIFWELPYWCTNLIRHNLDVMHVEKNVFDNIFNTVMDVKGKTKDNPKARKDIQKYCKRPDLELIELPGKTIKPKATFTLTNSQVKDICEWIKQLKLPDGYASNISRCVNVNTCKFSGLKSHDCHVFMERLLPIAFRDLLPKPVWDALTELSHFFRDICSTVLRVEHVETLEKNIVEIMCKLEKIFPPGFFDSMEHLPIHIAYEAKVGGPVQYRWMYPFERCMHHLKKKVRNKACVEGSICEAYSIEEISTFSSLYFEPNVETKLNRVQRNDDGGDVDPKGRLSIFTHPGRAFGELIVRRLSDEEFKAAEIYVLLNCEEIMPFVTEYEATLKVTQPNISNQQIEKLREKEFAKWLKEHVLGDTTVDHRIQEMAAGPNTLVRSYKGYFVNGYKFHTHEYGQNKKTRNSGVSVKGSCYDVYERDFYGQLVEIIELRYFGHNNNVTLFKCDWYDSEKGLRVDPLHGLIDIQHKSKLQSNEPFVLAEQAHQVYYATNLSRKRERSDWWTVIKIKARRTVDNIYSSDIPDDDAPPTTEGFYQEEEMHVPTCVGVDNELDRDGFLSGMGPGEEVDPNDLSTPNRREGDEDEYETEEEEEEEDEEEEEQEEAEEDEQEFESSSSDEDLEFDE